MFANTTKLLVSGQMQEMSNFLCATRLRRTAEILAQPAEPSWKQNKQKDYLQGQPTSFAAESNVRLAYCSSRMRRRTRLAPPENSWNLSG